MDSADGSAVGKQWTKGKRAIRQHIKVRLLSYLLSFVYIYLYIYIFFVILYTIKINIIYYNTNNK